MMPLQIPVETDRNARDIAALKYQQNAMHQHDSHAASIPYPPIRSGICPPTTLMLVIHEDRTSRVVKSDMPIHQVNAGSHRPQPDRNQISQANRGNHAQHAIGRKVQQRSARRRCEKYRREENRAEDQHGDDVRRSPLVVETDARMPSAHSKDQPGHGENCTNGPPISSVQLRSRSGRGNSSLFSTPISCTTFE